MRLQSLVSPKDRVAEMARFLRRIKERNGLLGTKVVTRTYGDSNVRNPWEGTHNYFKPIVT